MNSPIIHFPKGTLWQAILERTQSALACGALQCIRTDFTYVEQNGVNFLVRVAASLQRKNDEKQKRIEQKKSTGQEVNPFLPPDSELFVAKLTDSHSAVLNKFNVIDHHLLIITNHFEDQDTLLTPADFKALWNCMEEFEGLGFYNGGVVAGASQRHKHLQMVPLPMGNDGRLLPIDPLMEQVGNRSGQGKIPGFPFTHTLWPLTDIQGNTIEQNASMLHERYLKMLSAVGLEAIEKNGTKWQSAPYNLLVPRRWMLMVPRSREFCESISINSLGYAGSLFVKNPAELETVRQIGPMNVLRQVSVEAL